MKTIDDFLTFKQGEPELFDVVGDHFLTLHRTSAGLVLPVFTDGDKFCDPGQLDENIDVGNGFTLCANPTEKKKVAGKPNDEVYFGVIQKVHRLDESIIRRWTLRFTVGYGISEQGELRRIRINYAIDSPYFGQLRSTSELTGDDSLFEVVKNSHKRSDETKCTAIVWEYEPYSPNKVATKPTKLEFDTRGISQMRRGTKTRAFPDQLDYVKTLQMLVDVIQLQEIDSASFFCTAKREYFVSNPVTS